MSTAGVLVGKETREVKGITGCWSSRQTQQQWELLKFFIRYFYFLSKINLKSSLESEKEKKEKLVFEELWKTTKIFLETRLPITSPVALFFFSLSLVVYSSCSSHRTPSTNQAMLDSPEKLQHSFEHSK